MKTEELLKQLTEEGAKKPLMNPMLQSALWFSGMLIYLSILIAFSGLRPDFLRKIEGFDYISEIILLLAMAGSATIAAFYLSRPDSEQKPWIKYLPFSFIVPLLFVTYHQSPLPLDWQTISTSLLSDRLDCPSQIFLFSSLPAALLFIFVKKGATIHTHWAGTMVVLSTASFGYLFMRIIEANDNIAHLLIWHVIPLTLMCMLGMVIGHIYLKWRP